MISALLAGLSALMMVAHIYLAALNSHEAFRFAKQRRGAIASLKLTGNMHDETDAEFNRRMMNLHVRKGWATLGMAAAWFLVYAAMVL